MAPGIDRQSSAAIAELHVTHSFRPARRLVGRLLCDGDCLRAEYGFEDPDGELPPTGNDGWGHLADTSRFDDRHYHLQVRRLPFVADFTQYG